MNTFDDVKKAKWIVKKILPALLKTGTTVQFASLFLENDEDEEFYKEITFVSEANNFEDLVLFGVKFNNKIFNLKLFIQESNGISIFLNKYDTTGEIEEEQDTLNSNWRNVLIKIDRCLNLDRSGFDLDEAYKQLKKAWF